MERASKTEVSLEDLARNPRCPHGPTVLFKDSVKGKKRKYYSCSAYRDKKSCGFHVDKSSKITPGKRMNWSEQENRFLKHKNHAERYKHFIDFRSSQKQDGFFCQKCEIICDKTGHEDHTLTPFSATDLSAPSRILEAKSENKKEAQFFFSESSRDYLLKVVKKTGGTHVLCIGTPTLYEALPGSINKLFLDIDTKYLGLLSPEQFCWFNMMNFHFFHGDVAKNRLRSFIRSAGSNLTIFLDPPFGGRMELIHHTIQSIQSMLEQEMGRGVSKPKLCWIFPYFMERKLKELGLGLEMCEYRVSYINHKEYSGGEGGRNLGSPVRFFTNIPLSSLPLPNADEYKQCTDCGFYVSSTNRHCKECNACTSKDGRPYVHCADCSRCVKETYVHCADCVRCHLPAFKCKKENEQAEDNADGVTPNKPQAVEKQKSSEQSKKSGKRKYFGSRGRGGNNTKQRGGGGRGGKRRKF